MKNIEKKAESLIKKSKKIKSLTKIRRSSIKAFKEKHGYKPDLNTPKSFNEKLLFRKLNQRSILRSFSKYACKYSAREYVKSKTGPEYLVPLITVVNTPEEFSLSSLPQKFIMKATHGSGWNYIVRDKTAENEAQLKHLIAAWLSCNYSLNFTGESQYEDIQPRVVIEELLTDESGRVPQDLRFHCFGKGGKQKIVIQVDSSRDEEITRSHFDENWNELDVAIKYPRPDAPPPKPENLDSLLTVAKSISSEFDYCRVDLYSLGNKIYFGEITFLPINAQGKFTPSTMDFTFGGWLSGFNLTKDPLLKRYIR